MQGRTAQHAAKPELESEHPLWRAAAVQAAMHLTRPAFRSRTGSRDSSSSSFLRSAPRRHTSARRARMRATRPTRRNRQASSAQPAAPLGPAREVRRERSKPSGFLPLAHGCVGSRAGCPHLEELSKPLALGPNVFKQPRRGWRSCAVAGCSSGPSRGFADAPTHSTLHAWRVVHLSSQLLKLPVFTCWTPRRARVCLSELVLVVAFAVL